jgi:hypothetical protein
VLKQPEVHIIKQGVELPPTPEGCKLSFRQGIKDLDAARSATQRAGTDEAWYLQRHERLYYFVPVAVTK